MHPACPVCGTGITGAPSAPCPTCGLPAAGQAGWVIGRINATLTELTRDRNALLGTLRAAAPGAAPPLPPPALPSVPSAIPPPVAATAASRAAPPPPGWPAPGPAAPRRRRLTPQQVLLTLGALLLVAGALAFVALGWTRLGLVFQAAVLVALTAAACGASGWLARRGLRATEEALAAAGTALLTVDLGAAHARGLAGLDAVPPRTWAAVSCLAVVAVALLARRVTRSTTTWPLAALLAAQPVPLLLLPGELVTGPAGVATTLLLAALDLGAVLVLRRSLAGVARALAPLMATIGVLAGLLLASSAGPAESWSATLLLAGAGAAAVVGLRDPRLPGRPLRPGLVPGAAGAVVGLALAGSLGTLGAPGPVLATGLGLVLLCATAPAPGRSVARAVPAVLAGGTALAAVGALALADAHRYGALSLLALAAGVPAALTAVRVPRLRAGTTAGALLAPVVSVRLAQEASSFSAPTAGLLLSVAAAVAFAVAARRSRTAEEWVCAAVGAATGALAGATTGSVGAWGQVGLQLAVVGVAAGAYGLAAHRSLVAGAAVADLVLAGWIAVAGAGVGTPEAYTLPAAVGLLVVAWPRLRSGAPSWSAEGAAVGVALVPSTLAVAGAPAALRLVLVVVGAVAMVVAGTLRHRQAPFVVGAGALGFVVATRLGSYAPLVPTWVTLATAGLLLLVLGATYERRLQQAREAVAWVTQMS